MRTLLLAALVGALSVGLVPAAQTVPDGAFVKDATGDVWVVLNGERLRVPMHTTDAATIAAIPDSGRTIDIPREPPGAAPPPMTPTATPIAAPARTVLDAAVRVTPPETPGFCTELEPGRLTVATRLILRGAEGYPARLSFGRCRGHDPEVAIESTVAEGEASTTAILAGGPYCWNIAIDAPPSIRDLGEAELSTLTQEVALRMTVAPP